MWSKVELKSWAEQQRSLISGKTPLKMCHFTRHDLRFKGWEGVKQNDRANSTLGSFVSRGMACCHSIKEGQWRAIQGLSGRGTGGQKEIHVSDDCFCTICSGAWESWSGGTFWSKTREFIMSISVIISLFCIANKPIMQALKTIVSFWSKLCGLGTFRPH